MAVKKPTTTTTPTEDPAVAAFKAKLEAAGVIPQTQILGSSAFPYLQGMTGGLWNEASGTVENYDVPYSHPLYVAGDEWRQLPLGNDLAALQHQLIDAHFMSADNIVFGSPDQKTASAMADLLSASNAQGVIWETELARRLGQAAGQPPTGQSRNPLVVKLTNPDDIRAVIQSGANSVFGKYLDPAEVEKFVSSYQQQETAFQTAAYQATGYDPLTGQQDISGTGQPTAQGMTLTAPATGAGEQRQFFDQQVAAHPDESRVAVFQSKLGEILNALKGPA